jgi:hypothetical protein
MTILLAVPAIACASFCVWLTVRILNRRERWAKWTAVVLGLPVLYVPSFGPACWLCEHKIVKSKTAWIVYRPVIWLACEPELTGCGSTGRREECQQRRFEKRRPTRRTLECR